MNGAAAHDGRTGKASTGRVQVWKLVVEVTGTLRMAREVVLLVYR